jgi:hypothetical protein
MYSTFKKKEEKLIYFDNYILANDPDASLQGYI